MASLGEKIVELRKRRGWTQDLLGEKININGRHVSRWENNKQRPSVRTLKRLADVFGVDIDDLLGNAPAGESVAVAVPPEATDLYKRFQQVQQLNAEDQAMVYRLIDILATHKHVAKLLTGQHTS